jgi:hypothetical protein
MNINTNASASLVATLKQFVALCHKHPEAGIIVKARNAGLLSPNASPEVARQFILTLIAEVRQEASAK